MESRLLGAALMGRERKIEAEQIFMATGRRPNVEEMGLDDAGVELEKGFIKINDNLQTTNSNIYAAGDCASPIMLETVAGEDGKHRCAKCL